MIKIVTRSCQNVGKHLPLSEAALMPQLACRAEVVESLCQVSGVCFIVVSNFIVCILNLSHQWNELVLFDW